MRTSEILTVVGVVVAVLGWFVASLLRLYEAKRAHRHEVFTAVLAPAAQLLAALSLARAEDQSAWRSKRAQEFEECFTELVAAVGAVELVRKSKVSWAAQQLRRRLQAALSLAGDACDDLDPHARVLDFRQRVEIHRWKALTAREDFILMAGRSLEGWPRRPLRDLRSGRRADVKRIEAEVTRFKEELDERHAEWQLKIDEYTQAARATVPVQGRAVTHPTPTDA